LSRGKENILIEVSPGETRVAFVDTDGRLCELLFERKARPSRIGGIYRGRVIRVEKAIGGAFVNIGEGSEAFMAGAKDVHEGQSVIVEVTRDAAAGKGPSVRKKVTLAGRYLALTPGGGGIHWPRRLGKGRRRTEMEGILAKIAREDEGWAVRSLAENGDPENLVDEADRLRTRWREAESTRVNTLGVIVPPPSLVDRVLRDRAGDGDVFIDDRLAIAAAERLVSAEMPDLAGQLAFHDGAAGIFTDADIEAQIEAALEPRVKLPNGAEIIVESTEAMTVIDVNAAVSGGRGRRDDAALRINLAAAEAVAREVRLRNIGGLIVVDFISMRNRSHGRRLVEAQRRAFDRMVRPVDVLGMTAAGLIEITCRRDGPSLEEVLVASRMRDRMPSADGMACAALRAALRTRGGGHVVLVAGNDVIDALEGAHSIACEETRRRLGGILLLERDSGEGMYRIETRRTPP